MEKKVNIRQTIFHLAIGATYEFERALYLPDVIRNTANRIKLNYPPRKYSTKTTECCTTVKRIA